LNAIELSPARLRRIPSIASNGVFAVSIGQASTDANKYWTLPMKTSITQPSCRANTRALCVVYQWKLLRMTGVLHLRVSTRRLLVHKSNTSKCSAWITPVYGCRGGKSTPLTHFLFLARACCWICQADKYPQKVVINFI